MSLDSTLEARLEQAAGSSARREAADRLRREGLPGARSENWKYTRLAGLDALAWNTPAPADPTRANGLLQGLDTRLPLAGHRIVWANGVFQPALSRLEGLPEGLELRLLSPADEGELLDRWNSRGSKGEHPLDTLNAALFSTGCLLRVTAGVQCPQPIALVFLHDAAGEPGSLQCRTRIEVQAGAALSLVECHLGHNPGATAVLTMDLSLGEGARADLLRVQDVEGETLRVSHLFADLQTSAHLRTTTVCLQGDRVRNESRVSLQGPAADAVLGGLGLLEGDRHLDSHTWLDHAVPDCTSRQLFKHVLDDCSRAVFTGHILVRQDAQRTDAVQNSASLLLADEARANTRPQLEIYADDVKCTHGATVGHLEEEGLFYLRSRGIDSDTARRMLVRAFAQAVIEEAVHPELQGALGEWVRSRFENNGN
jgi:Fe-S cluster assembly protein SufD